jgi:hypothetical protein
MKHLMAAILAVLFVWTFGGCGSSTPAGSGGAGGGSERSSGGVPGTGGATGAGGAMASGGVRGTGGATGAGGAMSSGGVRGTGGSSVGGASGSGMQPDDCPYAVATFSCEAVCKKLHSLYGRCQNDPAVPSELQAMLGLYGQVEVVCASTCAVVAPASQAQWSCLQGVPDSAPCSAIAGCNASNCP